MFRFTPVSNDKISLDMSLEISVPIPFLHCTVVYCIIYQSMKVCKNMTQYLRVRQYDSDLNALMKIDFSRQTCAGQTDGRLELLSEPKMEN